MPVNQILPKGYRAAIDDAAFTRKCRKTFEKIKRSKFSQSFRITKSYKNTAESASNIPYRPLLVTAVTVTPMRR